MEWVFAALTIGAIVYIGLILMELTNYSMHLLPRIHQLSERAERLAETFDQEAEDLDGARARAVEAKTAVAKLTSELIEQHEGLRIERSRKQRLEMEYFKLRLRSRRSAMA